MAFSMENHTVETFLRSLELDNLIPSFKENDIDFKLLMDASDEELRDLLNEIHVTPGNRLRITRLKRKIKAVEHADMDVASPLLFHGEGSRTGFSVHTNIKDHKESKCHSNNSEKEISETNTPEQEEVEGRYGSPQIDISSKDCTKNEIRVALIGKTGSGKSATGNTILNKKAIFKSLFSYISITKGCSQGHAYRFGKKIVVVDTPGIFDTDLSNEQTQSEIMKCIGITSPGPHAFILVLSLSSRFTDEEQKTVDHFVKWFGETVYKYFIVLFTRKDELDRNKMTLEQHLSQVPVALKTFIDKCGGRVLAFNNELTGIESDSQVKALVDMIQENVVRNDGKCYTNEAYIKAEIEVKKMEEQILRKAREEAEEKLKKLRESKTKKEVEAEEEVVRNNLREREENIRDVTRKEIEDKGFLRRSVEYIRSWFPF